MGRTKCAETGNLSFKRGTQNGSHGSQKIFSKTGFDGLCEAPWRKCASIFKQPVTLVHTTSKDASKPSQQELTRRLCSVNIHRSSDISESPKQIFWSKSLEGLKAMAPVKNPLNSGTESFIENKLVLAPKTEAVINLLKEESASATLISAIQNNFGISLVGQQATKKQIEDNPLAVLTFPQPFAQISPITEQDIVTQERRVLDTRKRLQELRKSFAVR